MGLRVKVFVGLVLFVVIFGLRFLCANCQQVNPDIVAVENRIQPEAWLHHPNPTDPTNIDEVEKSPYQSAVSDSPENSRQPVNGLRRRRPGNRKRRRRPQGLQMTVTNDFSINYGQDRGQDEALNESMIPTIYNTSDYNTPVISESGEFHDAASPAPSLSQPKRMLPHKMRIEKIREPYSALEREQRLSEIRDQQRKGLSTGTPAIFRDKSYRKPYSQARRQDTTTQGPSRSGTDLKDILKNSGGLSLSEILQQKNLSLEDLIKGKQNALLALQTPAPSTSDPSNRFMKPIRRIPMSYLTSTAIPSIRSEISTEHGRSTFGDYVDIITAASDDMHPDGGSRDIIVKASMQEEPISSEPNLVYKTQQTPVEVHSIRENPPLDSNAEPSTKILVSTVPTRPTYRKRLTIKPTYNPLRDSPSSSESASSERTQIWQMKSSSSQESIEDNYYHSKPESNIIEKFSTFEEAKPKDVAPIEELFSSLYPKKDNSNLFEAITSRVELLAGQISRQKSDVTERNPSLFTDLSDEHIDTDDRTDLLELLEDRRSGNRLVKVLAQRNMTLEELIEHRKRGSSQLHLSEIANNKTATGKAFQIRPHVLDEKLDIVTAFDTFPHFNLVNLKSVKPDDIKTDSQGSSYFTSIIDIKPTDDEQKEGRSMKSLIVANSAELLPTAFPASGEDKSIDFYAQPWKSFALPVSYNSQEGNYIDQPAEPSARISEPKDHDNFDPVVQIENEVARAHDLLDLELTGHGFRRASILEDSAYPLGVRSAILVSGLIVLCSMAVFLIIFVVCRWKQRRHKKLVYAENYTKNAIKTSLPVISKRQLTMKRIDAMSSPMIFPASKHNKLNTMDPNSPEVQEYLYDAMRKPF